MQLIIFIIIIIIIIIIILLLLLLIIILIIIIMIMIIIIIYKSAIEKISKFHQAISHLSSYIAYMSRVGCWEQSLNVCI